MIKSGVKVFFSSILSMIIVFAVIAVFGGGTTKFVSAEEITDEINSAESFIAFGEEVNNGDNKLNRIYTLTSDIVLDVADYVPIGTNASPFQGKFNGNGHTVTVNGLSISKFVCGLFGYTGSSAVIDGLTVKGSFVSDYVMGNTDFVYAGSIVAINRGTISECINFAELTVAPPEGKPRVGGIAGVNEGTVVSCVNIGEIHGNRNVGGIVGFNDRDSARISSCVNLGKIYAFDTVGGIAGQSKGTINDSYSFGVIDSGIAQPSRRGMAVGYVTGLGASGRVYGLTDNANAPSAIGGSGVNTGNAFENKTTYDFLSIGGVDIGEELMVRADYGQGVGYFYAPYFLLYTDEQNKVLFKSDEIAQKFRYSLFKEGDGSESNPYIVSRREEWELFVVNAESFDYCGAYIELFDDIDIGGIGGVGNLSVPFGGKFNGNNKTITMNLEGGENTGLFECVRDAEINNIILQGEVRGLNNTGALVGTFTGNGRVYNITNDCAVSGNAYTGGIIGKAENVQTEIATCINNGNVKGTDYIGGIVGGVSGNAKLSDLCSYSSITSDKNGGSNVGGLVGRMVFDSENAVSLEKLHTEGSVYANRSSEVGGLFGYFENKKGSNVNFISVSAYATVTGRRYVGGLIGKTAGNVDIDNFVSSGYLKGVTYCGGIIGNAIEGEYENPTIIMKNGYFSGTITRDTGLNDIYISDVSVCADDGVAVSLTNVLYDADMGSVNNANGVIVKTGVELTDGTRFATAENEPYWNVGEPTFEKGNFPLINSNKIIDTTRTVIYYFDGKENEYNVISTSQGLKNFVLLNNSYKERGYDNAFYKFGDNIFLTDPIEPIKEFNGKLSGSGFTLNGLTIVDDGERIGLFGILNENAVIEGVMIDSGRIESSASTGYIGSIAGETVSGARIENCYSLCEINATEASVGGLVGLHGGNIGVSFFGGIINSGVSGGIAANVFGSITDSFSFGKVHGAQYSGGICAKTNEGATIERCYASDRVSGGDMYLGGIVAYSDCDVIDCYVIADLVPVETSAGAGAIAGATSGVFVRCYYNSEYIRLLAKPGITEEENAPYKKTADQFLNIKSDVPGPENEEITDKAIYGYYYVGLNNVAIEYNDDYDSRYTKRLKAFETLMRENEQINGYVKESVELNLFGRDTELRDEYGSADNPYLIENANQFLILGKLSREYTEYAEKHFKVVNDLDMSTATYESGIMKPIGLFKGDTYSENKAFSGKIYAEERKKIYRINMMREEEASFGIIGYTGSGFELRNLDFSGRIDADGAMSAATLVGYLIKGRIVACSSNVEIDGDGDYFGGLAGRTDVISSVVDSVYYGIMRYGGINEEAGEYGILGMGKGTVSVDTTNSWYIVDEDKNYVSNGYGSVLNNAGVEIAVVYDDEKSVGFQMANRDEYVANVLNSNDENVFANGTFYPQIKSDNKMDYYARYCLPVTFKSDGYELNNNISADGVLRIMRQGNGYYYVGQNIKFTVSWIKYGKYFAGLKINNVDFTDYTLSASSDDCIVFITMTENITDIDIITETIDSDIISFSKNSGRMYDGTDSAEDGEYTVSVPNYTMEVYEKKNDTFSKTNYIKNAGTYSIRIKISVSAENKTIIGIYETEYIINRKIISFKGVPEQFFKKSYDGTDIGIKYFNTSDGEYAQYAPEGIVDEKTFDIVYECWWSGINAGEGYDFKVVGCQVYDDYKTGLVSNNYEFDSSEFVTVYATKGVINKAVVEIMITDAVLVEDKMIFYHEYDGKRPVITDVFPTDIEWIYLDENGVSVAETDVGIYRLSGESKDDNYVLSWNTTYYAKILPCEVNTVNYGKLTGLYYNGIGIAMRGIQGYYSGITGDTNHEARIEFFADLDGDGLLSEDEEQNPITDNGGANAGVYFAKAYSKDLNYVINAPAEKIIINRAVDGGKIRFQVISNGNVVENKATVTVGQELKIKITDSITASTIIDDPFNMYISIFNTTSGGKIELLKEEVPTEDESTYAITENGETKYYAVYLNAVASGANVNFEISVTDALNYEDRISDGMTFSVRPLDLYVKLGRREFSYGDLIEPSRWSVGVDPSTLTEEELSSESAPYTENWLEFYIDARCTKKMDMADIRGYKAPSVSCSAKFEAGNVYSVIFTGGSSDGYTFIYEYDNESDLKSNEFVVVKKDIIIIPIEGSHKIYGEEDGNTIGYRIVEYVNGENKEITVLPNGEEVVLNGFLGRESGENVGKYDLTVGDFANAENNKNYEIYFVRYGNRDLSNTSYKFEIRSRKIILGVKPGQGKQFGEKDGKIELSIPETDGNGLVVNELLGIKDTLNVFDEAVIITREEGESIGRYSYYARIDLTKASGLNYDISSVDVAGEYYSIVQAIPNVYASVDDMPIYGNKTSDLNLKVTAYRGTVNVNGTYKAYTENGLDNDNTVFGRVYKEGDVSTESILIVEFIPDDTNYASVKTKLNVRVSKRPVSVVLHKGNAEIHSPADGAKFVYTGKNITESNFYCEVKNTIDDKNRYNITYTFNGDVRNVTEDGFTIKASLQSDYYYATNDVSARCYVSKAILSIKAENATIYAGEKFVPKFIYDGFVKGEDERVLDALPKVMETPAEGGYYSVIPFGAKSDNYQFDYEYSTLMIYEMSAEDGNVRIDGKFNPDFKLTVNNLTSGALSDTEGLLDKIQGYGTFSPSAYKLNEYLSLKTEGIMLSDECNYSVQLGKIGNSDKILFYLSDGTIKELEYTPSENTDGTEIRFSGKDVIGIAVYTPKDVKDMILGYLPLIGLIVGAVALIIVVIVIAVSRKRKNDVERNKYVAYRLPLKRKR